MIMAISLILISYRSFAQTAEELFPKGIQLEEVKGELEKAIEVYQTIVIQFSANRPIASKAQFHIGICYEKLGLEKARKAFQKVVEDYPDQVEMATKAREKLITLTRAQTIAQKEDKGMRIQLIWSGPGADFMGAVSPGGEYLSFTDWNTGDLAVRDLTTGKNRRITDKGPWIKSMEFALFPKWSQDGQFILYSWFNPESEFFELHVVGLKDSKPKILYNSTENEYVQPFDWHPNGEQVLVGFYRGGDTFEIGFLSVKDRSVQILKTFKQRYNTDPPWGFVISPDGRTIAYDNQYEQDFNTRDIFLLSSDGIHEQRLIDHPSFDYVLDWTSDGKHLLFNSERTGTTDMYIIRIEGGKPLGNPILVKPNLDPLFPMGCTRQDQFFYGVDDSGSDIYMAEFDPASGQFLAPPEKQVRHYEGRNAYPDYSPDGKYFVYISFRSSLPMAKNSICIYSLENGEIRNLDPGLGKFNFPQWRPDGRAISIIGTDEQDRKGIYLIDVQSEEVSPLVQVGTDERIYSHRWSVDGSTLFYTKSRTRRGSPSLIYALDMKTVQIRELPGSPEDAKDIEVSPDGKWLVFLNRSGKRSLGIIPAVGGEAQKLYSFDVMGEFTITPAWTPDGKYILFSSKDNPADEEWDMWRFSLETKQAQKLSLKMVGFRHPSIHPDGRHMIFSTEESQTHNSGVWMIENFLLKTETKK
jgi:Tol biopolymer transport system component